MAAVIDAESGFNPGSTSSAGAMGLMQIMPDTAAGLGLNSPYNPTANIQAGTQYLGQMLQAMGGNTELALAAYNWGIGNVQKAMKQYGNSWAAIKSHAPAETQGYVNKIMKNYRG